MIITPVKEDENIDKVLRKYKKKLEKTGILRAIKKRKAFTKPSMVRRKERQHAVYVQQMKEKGIF